jgi:hypothetical protein
MFAVDLDIYVADAPIYGLPLNGDATVFCNT